MCVEACEVDLRRFVHRPGPGLSSMLAVQHVCMCVLAQVRKLGVLYVVRRVHKS